MILSSRSLALLLSASLAVAACNATTEEPTSQGTPSAQGVAVKVTPASTSISVNGTTQLAAAVTGSANTAVAWTVVETSGGTVTTQGLYTAPGSPGLFHVRATSAADTSVHGDAAVTVTAPPAPVTVAVSPSPATVNSCKTVTFTATVSNTTNTAVTWTVQEGAAGGTISTAGVYTAPSTAGTYHVVATSVADTTKVVVTTVTVSDKILSVAVNPPTTSLQPGGNAQFTATVTTTCGSFIATGP